MGWEVDAGPLHLSGNGVSVRPQLKVGYTDSNVNIRAGLEDVRNGVSLALAGEVHRTYEAEGSGLKEAMTKLKRDSNIKILDDIIPKIPKLLTQVMNITKVRIAKDSPVSVTMLVKSGVGVSAAVCLGWADTEGFRMVGVRGTLAAGLGLGNDILIGRHTKEPTVKCVLGLPNVCMDMVFSNVQAKPAVEGPDEFGDGYEVV